MTVSLHVYRINLWPISYSVAERSLFGACTQCNLLTFCNAVGSQMSQLNHC